MLKTIIPIFLFLLLIHSASTSNSLRLSEIEKLLQRFDSTLDVNYLFYDVYRSQKRNPLLCKGEYGPYCSMINGKSITNGVLDTHDNLEIEGRKKFVIAEYDRLRTENIFGLSNIQRDKLLTPLIALAEQSKEIETLLTFEEAILNTEASEITNPLIFNKEKGGFRAEISKTAQIDKKDLKVTFERVYVPEVAKVADKKTMYEKSKMDKENEGRDFKEHKPVSVYAYTKPTEGGVMIFSKPVIVKQIWARKHDMDLHESEMKAIGKHKYHFEYDIKGQRDGKDVASFKKDWTDMTTHWTLLKPEGVVEKLERLEIPKNTDLDNILLDIEIEEEVKLMTMAEYQELIAHINIKLRNFANLEDDGLRNKILKDEVMLFLRKRNFDEEFIARLLKNLSIKKTDTDEFDVKVNDVESFVDKFILYKNFILVVNPGEARKIKEMLRSQLKDSSKKSPEFEGLTEDHLKQMLEKMEELDLDQADQVMLLSFMFEDKREDEDTDGNSGDSPSKSKEKEKKKGQSQDDL